jgi:hypothetical protein
MMIVLLTTLTVLWQAAAAPPACATPEYRQFDFWLGDWDVVPSGAPSDAGGRPSRNTISAGHGGCAILEHWRAASGGTGQSINAFDRSSGLWHQTWIDSSGSLNRYSGGLSGGNMVFHGWMPAPASPNVRLRVRLTFFNLGAGKVRQLSERLNADGSWSVNYDLLYTRRQP